MNTNNNQAEEESVSEAQRKYLDELNHHINHGGWKCSFCKYDGQNNQKGNRFCSNCHVHR